MTVRLLDPVTRDIVTSGKQFTDQTEEVAQTILTRLKLFLGEYFRDITLGTPWFDEILTKEGGASLASKDARIQEIILQTPDVVKLLTYQADFDINSRRYSISASVLTTFGEASIAVGDVISG